MRAAGGPILVADDDEDIREIIISILAEKGYHAVGAADGLEALGLMRAGVAPALVLVDLMMPRLSGVDLANRMHADPALATIPIVVLSGDRAARRVGAELGACATLVKPVNIDELLAAVSRCATVRTREHHPML